MSRKKELTAKQRKFIGEYLQCMNATEAAKIAGYSEKTGYSIGHRLLRNPVVKKAINDELEELYESQKRTFIGLSEDAINALHDIIMHGRGLARVNAANSVLDRAGHKPIDHIKSDVNANIKADVKVDAKSELIKRLNRLAANRGTTDANPVNADGSGGKFTQ